MGFRLIILSAVLVATSISLSGCISGLQAASLTTDEVMVNFNRSFNKLSSFDYNVDLELTGNLPNGLGGSMESAVVSLSGVINQADQQTTARISTQVQGVPVALNGQIISLDGYTYFQIQDLELPLSLSLDAEQLGQWYKIKHPQADSGSNLGGVKILSESIEEHSFETDRLFEVIETLPEETIGSDRSYHYQVRANIDVFISLLGQLEQTLPLKVGSTTLEQFDGYIFDLWLSKRTFFPTKIAFRDVFYNQSVPIGIDLDLTLSNHNNAHAISAPSGQTINEYDNLLGGFSVSF
jgi:hypothetical protein